MNEADDCGRNVFGSNRERFGLLPWRLSRQSGNRAQVLPPIKNGPTLAI
jgi:hypothetical protein